MYAGVTVYLDVDIRPAGEVRIYPGGEKPHDDAPLYDDGLRLGHLIPNSSCFPDLIQQHSQFLTKLGVMYLCVPLIGARLSHSAKLATLLD